MPNHTTSASEQWLRPREAEEIFGYNEKHLRRLAQRGDIEFKREGAREVRLLLTPVCRPDPLLRYFANAEAQRGISQEVRVRKESSDERGLLAREDKGWHARAFYFQEQTGAYLKWQGGSWVEDPSQAIFVLGDKPAEKKLTEAPKNMSFLNSSGNPIVNPKNLYLQDKTIESESDEETEDVTAAEQSRTMEDFIGV